MVNKPDEDMQILFLSTRCWNCTSNLFIIKLLCYSSSFPPSPSPLLFIYTSIQQLHRCPSVRLPFPVESAMEWVVMKLEDNIKFFTFIKCSLHYLQFPSHPHNFSFRHKIHLWKLFNEYLLARRASATTEHWSGWTEHLVWDPVTAHNNWVLLIFSCSSFIYLRIPINSVSHVNKLNLAGVGRMNPTHHMMWREVSVCLMCGCRFFLLFDKSKINAKHGVSLIACKVLCCYKDCNLFLCCLFSLVECGQGRQELRGWSEFYEMNCNAYLRFFNWKRNELHAIQ